MCVMSLGTLQLLPHPGSNREVSIQYLAFLLQLILSIEFPASFCLYHFNKMTVIEVTENFH